MQPPPHDSFLAAGGAGLGQPSPALDTPLAEKMARPRFRLWSIAIVSVVVYLVFKSLLPHHCESWWQNAVLSVFYTAGISEGCTLILLRLRKRFGQLSQTRLRLALQAVLMLAYVLLFKLFGGWLESAFWRPRASFEEEFQQGALFSLAITLLVVTIYEAAFFFDEWRRSAIRAERLQAQNALSQLEALKQQVDPHFLFNSLNTLAALIGDNKPAQNFLDELCTVYRYVLLSKDRSTVPLSEELAFVNSYIYLSKIRHQANLRFDMELSPAPAGYLPPLALQLLVENALKHNAATAQQPLTIRLWQPTDGTLAVTNNLIQRSSALPTTQQGLANLRSRYALLSERALEVLSTSREFEVRIPLLTA